MTQFLRRRPATICGPEPLDWPNPRASTGDEILTSGKLTLWEAKGPARKKLIELQRSVEKHLDKCGWEPPSSGLLTYGRRMVGESRDRAYPVLLILCNDPTEGQKVLDSINTGGLLKHYPGLRVMAQSTSSLRLLGNGEQITDQESALVQEASPFSKIEISGNQIFSTQDEKPVEVKHIATCGGFVRHNDKLYAFTARHPFEERALTGLDDYVVDLDAQEKLDDDQASRAPHLTVACSNLDYALFEIAKPYEFTDWIPNFTLDFTQVGTPDPESDDVKVICYTASNGVVSGSLDGASVYIRLPNTSQLQEAFEVHFNSPLAQGDCGSWVIDRATGALYGHVVAGCEQQYMAYIIPATAAFEHAAGLLNRDRLLESDLFLQALYPYGFEPATVYPIAETRYSKLAESDHSSQCSIQSKGDHFHDEIQLTANPVAQNAELDDVHAMPSLDRSEYAPSDQTLSMNAAVKGGRAVACSDGHSNGDGCDMPEVDDFWDLPEDITGWPNELQDAMDSFNFAWNPYITLQVCKVREFCSIKSMRSTQQERSRLIAWLADTTLEGGQSQRGAWWGPVTLEELSEALRKPVGYHSSYHPGRVLTVFGSELLDQVGGIAKHSQPQTGSSPPLAVTKTDD
jgi:hypothetical protein